MKGHKNARTTPHSRQILVERIGQGLPAWQVAQDLGISRQTVHKWLARVRSEGDSGLQERTSRPAHSPTRLSKSKLERIMTLRLQRLTAEQIAERLGLPRSTVAKHLSGLGMGKLPPLNPPPPVGHEPPEQFRRGSAPRSESMTDLGRAHVRCRSSTAQLSTAAITPPSAQVQALGALFVPYTPPLKSTLPQMVLHRPVEPATRC